MPIRRRPKGISVGGQFAPGERCNEVVSAPLKIMDTEQQMSNQEKMGEYTHQYSNQMAGMSAAWSGIVDAKQKLAQKRQWRQRLGRHFRGGATPTEFFEGWTKPSWKNECEKVNRRLTEQVEMIETLRVRPPKQLLEKDFLTTTDLMLNLNQELDTLPIRKLKPLVKRYINSTRMTIDNITEEASTLPEGWQKRSVEGQLGAIAVNFEHHTKLMQKLFGWERKRLLKKELKAAKEQYKRCGEAAEEMRQTIAELIEEDYSVTSVLFTKTRSMDPGVGLESKRYRLSQIEGNRFMEQNVKLDNVFIWEEIRLMATNRLMTDSPFNILADIRASSKTDMPTPPWPDPLR